MYVVCVQDFWFIFGVSSRFLGSVFKIFGPLPRTAPFWSAPSPGPPLRWTAPPPDRPKFCSFFSLSRRKFHPFFSLWGSFLWNFGGVSGPPYLRAATPPGRHPFRAATPSGPSPPFFFPHTEDEGSQSVSTAQNCRVRTPPLFTSNRRHDNRSPPRWCLGRLRPLRLRVSTPTRRQRTHELLHNQAEHPTACAMLAPHSCARCGVLTSLWPWRGWRGNFWSPQTICLQPHRPEPPVVLCAEDAQVLGRFSLSGAAQRPKQPHRRLLREGGEPSQCNGDTSVVSTASCAPPKSGNPSPKISIRRWSRGSGAAKSKSREVRWSRTWHLLLGKCGHQHSPLQTPAVPEPPLSHMQRDGGQKRREDGHMDTDVRREGEEGGGAFSGGHGRGGTQSSSKKLDGVVENATPAKGPLCDRNKACSCSAKRGINRPCVVVQCAMPLRAATRVVCRQVQNHLAPALEDVHHWRELPTMVFESLHSR